MKNLMKRFVGMLTHKSKAREVTIPFDGQNMQRATVVGVCFKTMFVYIRDGQNKDQSIFIEFLQPKPPCWNTKDYENLNRFFKEIGKSKSSLGVIKKEFYASGFQINSVETIRYWEKNYTKTSTVPSGFIIGTEEGTMYLVSFQKSKNFTPINK